MSQQLRMKSDKGGTFQAQKIKKPALKQFLILSQKKIFSYMENGTNFLALRLKKFLYFLKQSFTSISGHCIKIEIFS